MAVRWKVWASERDPRVRRDDAALRALLRETAWSSLVTADGAGLGSGRLKGVRVTADTVPRYLFDVCRARSPRDRKKALSHLYCPLSNQGTAGEPSAPAAAVLVESLRRDWCRDREPVYEVLEQIRECTVAEDDGVLADIRAVLAGGLDVFLADLERPEAESWPSLFELLIRMSPDHDVEIPARLSRLAERSTGELHRIASEAYRDALECIADTD